MAAKSGSFVGKNGHTYLVTLSGDSVGSGSLVLAGESPVVISMAAGEHKFCGMKTQTCKVRIVTDTPMLELYAGNARAVTLTVSETTTGRVMFSGYVTPFAYTQPYDGRLDVVEIDAVDRISAHKDVKYVNMSSPYGVDVTALSIVQEICRRSKVYKVVVHDNFSSGESLSGTMVAQAGFLQDEVSDADALSAIAKFFGYTAHMYGDVLYLYDEHCLAKGWTEATRYVYSSGWRSSSEYLSVQSVDKVRSGVTINVERAYDGIQISPEGSDVSVLLPDVCADENLEDLDYNDGKNGARRTYANGSVIDYRTPRRSKVLATGKGGASLTNLVVSGSDYMTSADPWADGSLPMHYVRYENTEVVFDGDTSGAKVPSLKESTNMLWVRNRNLQTSGTVLMARQRENCRYSHTGGFVKVSSSQLVRRITTGGEILPPSSDEEEKTPLRMWWLQVSCGGEWLQRSYDTSTAEGPVLKHVWGSQAVSPFISDEGKLVVSEESTIHNEDEFIFEVPNAGQVYLEMAKPIREIKQRDIYFTSLKMEGVGDDVNLESSQMRYGDGTGDVLEVQSMLTTRASGVTSVSNLDGRIRYGVNARPAVVTDTIWSGGYYGGYSGYSGIPMSGVLLEQLTERYTAPRLAYQMTVCDVVLPFCAVSYEGGYRTVESYDIDLYESETSVLID